MRGLTCTDPSGLQPASKSTTGLQFRPRGLPVHATVAITAKAGRDEDPDEVLIAVQRSLICAVWMCEVAALRSVTYVHKRGWS